LTFDCRSVGDDPVQRFRSPLLRFGEQKFLLPDLLLPSRPRFGAGIFLAAEKSSGYKIRNQ